jgi:glycosyltransferase involved in cell wall biosynthesis
VRFSLVLATVGRSDDLGRFLASLRNQTYGDFELIVVDQNPDDRLAPILAPYESVFRILHLRSEARGASRARNLGLQHISGEAVAFPDDDCLYPPDTLATSARLLADHPEWDGLTGRSVDEAGRTSMGRFSERPGGLDKISAWLRGIEYTIFLRAACVKELRFDEELGVGAGTPWGAGEGTDLLLQLLERGASLNYDPNLVVVHPWRSPPYDERAMRRAYSYGCGMGRTLKKHRMPPWFKAKWLIRPLGGALLSLLGRRLPEAEYRWKTFRGRLRGVLS